MRTSVLQLQGTNFLLRIQMSLKGRALILDEKIAGQHFDFNLNRESNQPCYTSDLQKLELLNGDCFKLNGLW